jgi:uncharacterized membrane protein YsdA (DUF1294 family)/cold shock CspA family protein
MGGVITGRIVEWSHEKGFGYLQVGKKRVFLHRRDFAERHKAPEVGDVVRFEMGSDRKGRPCAKGAAHVNDGGRLTFLDVFALVVLVVLPCLALYVRQIDLWLAAGVAMAISALTFWVYTHDKKRARNGGWRVPETQLHLLEWLGGWPGAFLAQRKFRHKCSKIGYQLIFWLIILTYQFVAFESLNDWRMSRSLWGTATTVTPVRK